MKRLVLSAMALAAVCVMPSCNKERTGITFGDYTGMIVTPYDTVSMQHTTDFTDQWGYLVDLNGDGENNIRLYTSVSDHGLSVSAIHCIDDDLTQIVCKKVEKQRYLHSDTTYRQTGDTTHVTITEIYTFHKIDEADIVEHLETISIPQAYNDGDLFILNKNSFPESVTLYMHATESNYTAYTADPYKQTHYHTVYKNDYDRFPLDEEKYIGFRFTDADRFRYGWMKIKLYNNEGNYFVKLLETAIQE